MKLGALDRVLDRNLRLGKSFLLRFCFSRESGSRLHTKILGGRLMFSFCLEIRNKFGGFSNAVGVPKGGCVEYQ